MAQHGRRDVLKYTGTAVIGGSLTTGVATADADDEPSSLEESDGWSSLGGNPGNNAVVAGEDPEPPVAVAWEYDHSGPVAVVDGTVYLTADGEVHALDADDGTLEWKTEAIGATGTPAVTSDAVYVGGERLSRIDPDTGEICCQSDLGYDEAIPSPAIANGLVFVVADGVLYAVDAHDNEERWHFEPDGDAPFEQPVAVADGAVFAVSESRVFALELEDGTVRWTDDEPVGDDEYSHVTPPNSRQISYPVASEDVVAIGSVDSEPAAVWPSGYATLYDTETGEKRVSGDRGPYTPGPIADDRFYARDSHDLEGHGRDAGDREWETEVNTYHVSSAAVGDGTVYAGLTISGGYPAGEAPEPEVGVYAFDDETGETEWAVDTEGEPELALADGTLYASADTLVAVRSEDDERDEEPADGEGDENGSDAAESDGSSDADGTTNGEPNESETDSTGTGNESDDGAGIGSNAESNVESNDDESEGMPGFTAGAGIVGSAATLEWLRRRSVDDETE